jgi:hypothetical protein
MGAWERDYASITDQMRHEMMLLRKERAFRQREHIIKNDNLAIAKRELAAKRRESKREPCILRRTCVGLTD